MAGAGRVPYRPEPEIFAPIIRLSLLLCIFVAASAVAPSSSALSWQRHPGRGRSSAGALKLLRGHSAAWARASGRRLREEDIRAELKELQAKAAEQRKGDEWCSGMPNGFYADVLAAVPCSGYFQCRLHTLAGLYACPSGMLYSNALSTCVPPPMSSCALSAFPAPPLPSSSSNCSSSGSSNHSSACAASHVQHRRSMADASGLNYAAADAELAQTSALLEFRASVLDFSGLLATWTLPRLGGGRCPLGPCNASKACWQHVTCSARGQVTTISIDVSGGEAAGSTTYLTPLSGALGSQSIPPSFGNLTALQSLSIIGNDVLGLYGLTGSIPVEMSGCKALSSIVLTSNHIITDLANDAVPRLPSLQYLSLGSNWLTGSLPADVSKLSKLQHLDLSVNYYNGSLPDVLSHLKALTYLNLATNYLSGSLPALPLSLAELDLFSNSLSGPLPNTLSMMATLSALVLHNNQFNGTLPAMPSSLKALDVGENGLTGKLPIKEACVPNIVAFSLGFNNFTSGPLWSTDVAECGTAAPTLSIFNVSGNRLTGTLPPDMFVSLSYLQTFDASHNQLNGSLPSSLLGLQTLQILYLPSNNFSGHLPPFLCGVVETLYGPLPAGMVQIVLANNSLTGVLPTKAICSTLTYLDLSNNQLQGGLSEITTTKNFGPRFLGLSNNLFTASLPVPTNCSGLGTYDAAGNHFSGPLPNLSKCTTLGSLTLQANNLTGPFRPAFLPTVLGSLDLSGNSLSGPIPVSITSLKYLYSLNLAGNALNGSVPANMSSLQRLQLLDLSDNQLSVLPGVLGNITALSYLDVSRNNFSGGIPLTLAPPALPHAAYLNFSRNAFNGSIPYGFGGVNASTAVDFSYNRLCGQVPPGNLTQYSNASVFEGNLCLCNASGLPECPPPPSAESSSSLSTGAIVGIAVGCAAFLVLLVLLLWYLLFYSRRSKVWEGGTMLVFEKLEFKLNVNTILDSTEMFSDKYMLGRGGFGSVYRATLADGRTVAIKRLAVGSGQGQKEFEAEMRTLGNIKHRNLVVLVAAWVARPPSTEKLLVYDFLSGGSLDHVLAKDMPKGSPLREWGVRLKIILDTARGMKYLHHDCTPRIIHRDMKPANVLLDDELNARVADFGLAREITDPSKTHVSTAVFGTIGYLAPEYTTRGRLSFKSDVFAFGVLVLQVITGRQPTDEEVSERGLARWVGAHSALQVCDQRIDDSEAHLNEVMGVITIGLRCTARVASDRPSMAEVVYSLENLGDFAKGFGAAKKNDLNG